VSPRAVASHQLRTGAEAVRAAKLRVDSRQPTDGHASSVSGETAVPIGWCKYRRSAPTESHWRVVFEPKTGQIDEVLEDLTALRSGTTFEHLGIANYLPARYLVGSGNPISQEQCTGRLARCSSPSSTPSPVGSCVSH